MRKQKATLWMAGRLLASSDDTSFLNNHHHIWWFENHVRAYLRAESVRWGAMENLGLGTPDKRRGGGGDSSRDGSSPVSESSTRRPRDSCCGASVGGGSAGGVVCDLAGGVGGLQKTATPQLSHAMGCRQSSSSGSHRTCRNAVCSIETK